MDWGGVIKDLALNGATTFATALGGPLAGDVVQRLGKALLGKDDATPAEVQQAITNLTGDQIVALKKADLEYQQHLADNGIQLQLAEINADVSTIAAVNATMQSETQSDHWPTYSWRPFIGFTYGVAFLFVAGLVCLLGYKAVVENDIAALDMIPKLVTAFATLFAMPSAILGVSAWFRGKMQADPSIPTDNRG